MPMLSITRLRLKSGWTVFRFLKNSSQCIQQAQEMKGLLGGATRFDWGFVFWTVTLWEDLKSMQTYVGTGPHLESMKYLKHWCDEAAVTHVEFQGTKLPDHLEIEKILWNQPKFATVVSPSQNHQSKTPSVSKMFHYGAFKGGLQ